MSVSLFPFSLNKTFVPANKIGPAQLQDEPPLLFIFHNNQLLVAPSPSGYIIPRQSLTAVAGLEIDYRRYIGQYDNIHCYLIIAGELFSPAADLEWKNLRALHGLLPHDHYLLAGKCSELATWYQTNIFCGRCGTSMVDHATECARMCPSCNFLAFPRISPVVIMTIEQGDNILLGRSPHFPEGMYSPLAGFVDAGETAEEAVLREAKEEAGVTVKNLRYITSQVWPYPHSLMLGFRTDYDHGQLIIEREELEDARWFNIHNLPVLPSNISISRYLMDCFIREKNEIV